MVDLSFSAKLKDKIKKFTKIGFHEVELINPVDKSNIQDSKIHKFPHIPSSRFQPIHLNGSVSPKHNQDEHSISHSVIRSNKLPLLNLTPISGKTKFDLRSSSNTCRSSTLSKSRINISELSISKIRLPLATSSNKAIHFELRKYVTNSQKKKK